VAGNSFAMLPVDVVNVGFSGCTSLHLQPITRVYVCMNVCLSVRLCVVLRDLIDAYINIDIDLTADRVTESFQVLTNSIDETNILYIDRIRRYELCLFTAVSRTAMTSIYLYQSTIHTYIQVL